MVKRVIAKILSLQKAIHYTFWLGLLTLLLVTAVFPAVAHSDLRLGIFEDRRDARPTTLVTGERKNSTFNIEYSKSRSPITKSNASTLLEQGRNLFDAGRFSEAADLWEQAAKIFQAESDRTQLALTLNYLSNAYQELGKWEQAKDTISQSLELLQSQHNPAILAQALNTQGSLELAMGKPEIALDTWQKAEKVYKQAGDETGILGSQINQAQALQSLGLYRRAQITLEQVDRKLQAQPDFLLKATGLRSLGIALQVVGDLTKSQEILEQSLAVAQRLNSPSDISAAFFSLGNTFRGLQKPEVAIVNYQKAAANAIASLAKLQSFLNQLSLLVETKQLATAQTLLPQIRSELANLSPSREAVYAQVNFASSLMKIAGSQGSAGGTPAGSLELGSAGGTPAGSLELGSAGGTPAGSLETGSKVAQAGRLRDLLRREEIPYYSTGETPVLQSSIHYLLPNSQEIAQVLAKAVQQARMLKDPRAESFALGELGYLYEQTQQWEPAKNLTQQALAIAQGINASDIVAQKQAQLGKILFQLGDIPKAIAAYTEAVNTLQSLRSDLVAINPDVQFSFRDSIEPIYRELVALLLQPLPSQQHLKQAREVIEALQLAELENFFREACLDAKPQQIDLLDPTAAVIYPIILPDRLAVILSLPGQPLRHYKTDLQQRDVEKTLEQLLESLNPFFDNQERLRFSQQVYDWLIRPEEAELAESKVKTLVFVLDGLLRNLPMAALYDGKQYLIEKYGIAVAPGLQLVAARSLSSERFKMLTGGLTASRQGFSALPAVKLEVERIASEVPSKIFLNQVFTETNLQNQIQTNSYPVVHLATHGQFSSNPEQTFILTWDEKIKVKELENLLRSREQSRSNPIELLVLSACQTAVGDKRAALGLAGVAVRSGARSTLATLWSVKDESTAQLMAAFYQLLSQGATKALALRSAQLDLLKQPKYEHPFYWAPFILVGNWL